MFQKEFIVKEKDGLFLVTPEHIGVTWTKDNLIYRSSIWDTDGNPVSLSYKKFFNWGEHPHLYTYPKTLEECSIMEKIDGSTLIVTRYKKGWIFRTRGSFDLLHLENSVEVLDFVQDNPNIFTFEDKETWENSYIFEWYSPKNRIVLDYGDKPIFWLTNIIRHKDYSYWKQDDLDIFATKFNLKRPKRYKYSSLEELKKVIQEIPNFEGVCVYFNNDQDILKLKSESYLIKHAFKSTCNLNTVVDLWFEYKQPDLDAFIKILNSQFDYECAQYAYPFIRQISVAGTKMQYFLNSIHAHLEIYKDLSRKDFAIKTLDIYGKGSIKSALIFNQLSGKELTEDMLKKLLFYYLEN